MSIFKKLVISVGWLVAFIVVSSLLGNLTLNSPGEASIGSIASRASTLLLISIIGITPLILAVLVWFGRPKRFYGLQSKSTKNVNSVGLTQNDQHQLYAYRTKIVNDTKYHSVVATVASLLEIPESIREAVSKAQLKEFPLQKDGYAGIAWIEDHSGVISLMFTPVIFNNPNNSNYWSDMSIPLFEINDIKNIETPSSRILMITDKHNQRLEFKALMNDESFKLLANFIKIRK